MVVLWGRTGTGKTKRAYALASKCLDPLTNEPVRYYSKASYNKWWPNYAGQQLVIIDEYAGQWDMGYLLSVLDRYPLDIEYKGGGLQLQATKFIITSNLHPAEWYTTAKLEHKEALNRRLTTVINVESLEQEIDIQL